jgi:hypothetical protein
MVVKRLSTSLACRVVGLNRDRFNEYVAAGSFPCAPATVPGRARLFDPNDMLTLHLFKRLMDDGYTVGSAGKIACEIGLVAKCNPEARAITYVETYFPGGTACLPEDVPPVESWDSEGFGPGPVKPDIRKVTTFRIAKERDLVAHYTDEETSTFRDPADEE